MVRSACPCSVLRWWLWLQGAVSCWHASPEDSSVKPSLVRNRDTTEGPPELSLAELEAAVHRSPGDAEAWRQLADAYRWAFMPEMSAEVLLQAVRLTPRDFELRRELGFALVSSGRARDSIPHFQEALRLHPGDASWGTFLVGFGFGHGGSFGCCRTGR